jgi:hypothetical protein
VLVCSCSSSSSSGGNSSSGNSSSGNSSSGSHQQALRDQGALLVRGLALASYPTAATTCGASAAAAGRPACVLVCSRSSSTSSGGTAPLALQAQGVLQVLGVVAGLVSHGSSNLCSLQQTDSSCRGGRGGLGQA